MPWHTPVKRNSGDFGKASDQNNDQDNFLFLCNGTRIETDLVTQASIAANAVGQGELKTSVPTSNSVTNGTANFVMNVGAYAFVPRIRGVHDGTSGTTGTFSGRHCEASPCGCGVDTGHAARIWLRATNIAGGSMTTYFDDISVMASPPYTLPFGEDPHAWLFLVRDKNTGKVRMASYSGQPPWAMLKSSLHKDHPYGMAMLPHPFVDFLDSPVPDGLEIVMVDLRGMLNEVSRVSLKEAKLAALQEDREHMLKHEVPEVDLDVFETRAQREVDDKAMDHADLAGRLAILMESKEALQERGLGILDAKFLKKKRERIADIESQIAYIDGRLPSSKMLELQMIEQNMQVRGKSILDIVNGHHEPNNSAERAILKASQASDTISDADKLPRVLCRRDRVPWPDMVRVVGCRT